MSPPDTPSPLDEVLLESNREKEIEEALEEACVFTQGEILLIRGGFFKVRAHSGSRLYLDFVGFAKDVLKRP